MRNFQPPIIAKRLIEGEVINGKFVENRSLTALIAAFIKNTNEFIECLDKLPRVIDGECSPVAGALDKEVTR